MQIFIGPVLTRGEGYAFDCWTSDKGLQRGYTYRSVEDAHYARKFDIRSRVKDGSERMVACNTLDEFMQLSGASPSAALVGSMQFGSNKQSSIPVVEAMLRSVVDQRFTSDQDGSKRCPEPSEKKGFPKD